MQPSPKTSNWTSRYADWLIRHPWLVLISAILITLFLASGASKLGFNNNYRVFFSEENPQLQEFEQLQRTYTKIDNILLAIETKDGNAFSNNALAAAEALTEKSWLIPYALRVDSISNFQHTYAEEDDLIVEDLVTNAPAIDDFNLKLLKQVALSEPLLAERIVNNAGSVSGVNITFQMPQVSPKEVPEVVKATRAIVAEIEQQYDVKIHQTGMVMLSNAFFEASMKDMSTLVPIMYLMIIVIMYLLVRSISATISAVIVIFFSMIAAMGFAGHLGIQLTPPSASATTIIMTLAVADSIHILVSMFAAMRNGMSKNDALKESIQVNFGPVFLTSVTTAIGFLSMNFSDAPPFHDLGNITAMGVMVAFLLSISLLPALMVILPAKASKSSTSIGNSMDKLANFVIGNQKKILFGSAIVSVVLVSSIQMNRLEDNFIGYFDQTQEFRNASDFVTDELTGIYQLQYSLDSGETNGISNPEFLNKLDNFTQWLREQPEVRHVNSLSDTFKRLNMNLHADDKSYYRLPTDPELAAQYLLLYELSLPYGLDLNNQINVSKSSTQVIVALNHISSTELRSIAERGTKWLEENAQIKAYGVGPAIMFAYISDRNIDGMLLGTGVAMIIISLLIGLALRSTKLGLLSLIPNLLPAALAFGLWGLMVGQVNMAVSMVTGMALGIVVDDTVHFLSKYLRVRRQGLSAEKAVRYAFSSVGIAIVVTSIILVAGFSVLSQSSFGMNSNMAILTAIAILMALIADFLLLPVLLLKLDKKAYQAQPEQPTSNTSSTRLTPTN